MSSDPRSSEIASATGTPAPFARVAVLGLGVMGGSLARAAAARWPAACLSGWSPDPAERRAFDASVEVGDAAPTPEHAVDGADLVVLAVPIDAALELVERLGPMLGRETIMDVVSLKAPMAEAAARAGLSDRWIGSHPMAGSEASGFGASRIDLYQGARVWLCASDRARATRGEAVEAFWSGVGARAAWIEPEGHDRLMALVSHLPQLASNALAAELAAQGVDAAALGPGGRDATRLARSTPEMWSGLFARAPHVLGDALRGVGARLEELADALDAGDLERIEALMTATRAWKDRAEEHGS